MRTLLILLTGVTAVAIAAYAYPAARERAELWLAPVLLPFQIAAFVAEPADTLLRVPVEGLEVTAIADTFGEPRGADRSHEGQDLFASRGTPVLPAADGYVVRVGDNTLGGLVVFVAGRGGRGYYYAHLDSYGPNAVAGTFVTSESVLGYVGTSGNAAGTPPHLHFGIYGSEGAIDPLPLFMKP